MKREIYQIYFYLSNYNLFNSRLIWYYFDSYNRDHRNVPDVSIFSCRACFAFLIDRSDTTAQDTRIHTCRPSVFTMFWEFSNDEKPAGKLRGIERLVRRWLIPVRGSYEQRSWNRTRPPDTTNTSSSAGIAICHSDSQFCRLKHDCPNTHATRVRWAYPGIPAERSTTQFEIKRWRKPSKFKLAESPN